MYVKLLIKSLVLALFITFITALSGCSKKTQGGEAYFGGVIRNPVSKYVLLYRNYVPDNKADTFFLDKNGKFGHKILLDSADMFVFCHGNQINMCYIRPGDSISTYTNTISFDLSFQFSGKGSKFNNLLLNISLGNINALRDITNTLPQLSKDALLRSITKFRKKKQKIIDDYRTRNKINEFSGKEKLVLDYSIYMTDYFLIERYNAIHPEDTLFYSIPFDFSFKQTYHTLNFFLGPYTSAYLDRRLQLPDSVTAKVCIEKFRATDTIIYDTLLNDFAKFQLLLNQLHAQKTPPSAQQIKDLYLAIPQMFHQPLYYSHEFVKVFSQFPDFINIFNTDSIKKARCE